MKFTKIALTLACSMVLLCGCANNSDVVLKVNDKEITHGEYYGDLAKIRNIQLKDAPREIQKESSYASLILKDKYTNDLIVRTLLEEEFEKRKIETTEDEIKAKKDAIIKRIGSEEEFNKKLKESNISQERLNKDMANEVKVEKLVNQITGSTKVSDADVEKFYKANKEQFTTPERVEAAHILFDTNIDAIKRDLTEKDKEGKMSSKDIELKAKEEIAAKETLAREVADKLAKNPKEFAAYAKKYSDDTASAEKGGDLGFITRESVVKPFGDVAFTQKVGTVSPLVKTQFGLHIIYVKDRAAAGTQSLASVKNDLAAYLTEQKKAEVFQKYLEGLKNAAKIEYIDESLKPENIRKQLEEALPKQLEFEKNKFAPKANKKALEKPASKEEPKQEEAKKEDK